MVSASARKLTKHINTMSYQYMSTFDSKPKQMLLKTRAIRQNIIEYEN